MENNDGILEDSDGQTWCAFLLYASAVQSLFMYPTPD